jgi:hypothetical protein
MESRIAGPTGQIAPEGIDHVFVHKQDFMAAHIRHVYGGVNAIQHREERLVRFSQFRFRLLAVGNIKIDRHQKAVAGFVDETANKEQLRIAPSCSPQEGLEIGNVILSFGHLDKTAAICQD